MYQEIDAGYSLLGAITSPDSQEINRSSTAGLEGAVILYFAETATCIDKAKLWEQIGFKKNIARDLKVEPKNIGMVKTILFSYLRENQERYFLVSTLAERKVDYNEIRVELGLSGQQTQTITHKISDATLESITGKKRGAVSPLLDQEYLAKIDAVYFTHDLMDDAARNPEKKYDLPRSPSVSEFWNAARLFDLLRSKSPKYKSAGEVETELKILDLKYKQIPQTAGYEFLFRGTTVEYRGQQYQITNPPLKKEGIDRRRKQIGCTAFPIARSENGTINYEYTERGRKRLILPLTFEILAQSVQP